MKQFYRLSCLVWFALFFFLAVGAAQAQQDAQLDEDEKILNLAHDRIIKFRPLDIGQVSFAYEKLRSARVSNELGISYVYKTFFKDAESYADGKKVNGAAIRMSQRHYTTMKKKAPFGFYHGPVFGYKILVFEEGVFGVENLPQSDPDYRFVGRLYQNSIELGYQIGGQFQMGKHLTMEVGGSLGARMKYALSTAADELLTENIIGHAMVAEKNSAVFLVPLPQFHLSLGYSF